MTVVKSFQIIYANLSDQAPRLSMLSLKVLMFYL